MTVPADGPSTSSGLSQPPPALGFLTILEHEQHGLVGGYLILNAVGRPLEFHCTAPLKANRAQQILFGPTLDAYLYGEQIGQTLLDKCGLDLLAVWTDVERALCVRDYVSHPVALVLGHELVPGNEIEAAHLSPPSPSMNFGELSRAGEGPGVRVTSTNSTPSTSVWRVDAAHRAGPHLAEFSIGHNRLAVGAHRDADRAVIVERLESLATFDLAEPFERIRQAVEEAHKSPRPSTP